MVRAIVIVLAIFILQFINAVELHPRTSLWPWNQDNVHFECILPKLGNMNNPTNHNGTCVSLKRCRVPEELKDGEREEWLRQAKCGHMDNPNDYKYCCYTGYVDLDDYDITGPDVSPIRVTNKNKGIDYIITPYRQDNTPRHDNSDSNLVIIAEQYGHYSINRN